VNRIRLGLVIDKLSLAGAQRSLALLARGLDPARFAVRVFALLDGGPVADTLSKRGIPVEVMGLGRLYAPRGVAGLGALARRFRDERISVVQTYLVSANIFGALAARRAGVDAIVTTRRDTGFSRNWRLRLIEQWLVNPRVDRVVAVSSAAAEAARLESGMTAERIVTIENGIDVEEWSPRRHDVSEVRREWGLSSDDTAVGVVARLDPIKGQTDFLRAAALVVRDGAAARFFLIGDGPQRSELEELARSLGIADRVVLTGARRDVASLMSMLDVVVVPSLTEGMSNALLEAMALEKPVVATAVGGNIDVVEAGRTGELVPASDPRALATAIRGLLRESERARSLGTAARRRIVERFSAQRMVERYASLYASLI